MAENSLKNSVHPVGSGVIAPRMTAIFLKNKPFWALFGTQFLGAFNDNFFRTSLVTLITYHLTIYSETTKSLFISAAFGLFMLPFFVFSPLAGQLTDRFDKSKIIRLVKAAEIIIVGLSVYGFIHEDPYFLLSALFCMGVHSAFFGPAKYSLLPELLASQDLLKGNGYIEAGTFLAVMSGTVWGALMVHSNLSPCLLGFQLFFIALVGFLVSWKIPSLPSNAPNLKIRWSWVFEMKRLLEFTSDHPKIYKAIIGISWFWFVGTILLSNLPSLAKSVLGLEEGVFIFLLFLFTLGIGIGSLLCHRILKGEITIKQAPFLAFLMGPFLLDLSSFQSPLEFAPVGLFSFLTSFQGLRLSFDLFGLSFLGGVFVVPLYVFIQAHVIPSRLSQVIALGNIFIAGFMVLASLFSFALLSLGFSISWLIFLTAFGQICVGLYMLQILSDG